MRWILWILGKKVRSQTEWWVSLGSHGPVKMGSSGEEEERGGDVGACGVGPIAEATISCIAPASEESREVGEIWSLSTGQWVGCEYCELSSGGTAVRFLSKWGWAATDEEGASGLVREAMASASSCCRTVRGNVV